jgi:hypothetical protein
LFIKVTFLEFWEFPNKIPHNGFKKMKNAFLWTCPSFNSCCHHMLALFIEQLKSLPHTVLYIPCIFYFTFTGFFILLYARIFIAFCPCKCSTSLAAKFGMMHQCSFQSLECYLPYSVLWPSSSCISGGTFRYLMYPWAFSWFYWSKGN